jgi:allatostatin C receptor
MALINSSPEVCQSKLEITIFILVGCLGYSNSAMNPILYAFLSDNFKKSFMKAFTCAKTKEINAQLHVENSFFPRFGKSRNSECFSRPTTNLVSNANMTSKLTQSTKFGNTVESILSFNNGHENGHTTNGHHNNTTDMAMLNNVGNHSGDGSADEDEHEMENKQTDNSICIINSGARPPVLHTDL